jgi:hypothetical protein
LAELELAFAFDEIGRGSSIASEREPGWLCFDTRSGRGKKKEDECGNCFTGEREIWSQVEGNQVDFESTFFSTKQTRAPMKE